MAQLSAKKRREREAQIEAAFEKAQALWDVRVNLAPPDAYQRTGEKQDKDPIAFIRMDTRQIVVNHDRLAAMGVPDCLATVLAHEIGHHIYYPHSLGHAARLEVFARKLLPTRYDNSLLNLFFDLQINERLGRDPSTQEQLARVYEATWKQPDTRAPDAGWRASDVTDQLEDLEDALQTKRRKKRTKKQQAKAASPPSAAPVKQLTPKEAAKAQAAKKEQEQKEKREREEREKGTGHPVFNFYLAIYEELWRSARGRLLPKAARKRMDDSYPGWRDEARMFAQTFFPLYSDFVQLAYFCSVFSRYLEVDSLNGVRFALGGDAIGPSVDDYAGALYPTPAAEDALREAKARGWLPEGVSPERWDDSPFTAIGGIVAGQPGRGAKDFKRALVERLYRRHVEKHLFEMPRDEAESPSASIPSVTEAWEPGDDPRSIDWIASALYQGPFAAALPLRRELLPDGTTDLAASVPPLEVYLDTSGSMPNPLNALNAMTLAALVLATAAIRAESRVRGVVYSWGTPLRSDWMYDEVRAREFLLSFSGGGTKFPFALMREFAEDTRDAVRIIISDADFIANVRPPGAVKEFDLALNHSRRIVLLMHLPNPKRVANLKGVLKKRMGDPRLTVVPVSSLGNLAGVARDLGRALFSKRGAKT
ncbi:MAG: DUF2201 family putative metallopeptidase [Planctomycetota bacterium]